MRAAATFDALTGLLNRREVVNYLRLELSRSSREKRTVSVIVADLDHFKTINDWHGHLVGDEVSKDVARRYRVPCGPTIEWGGTAVKSSRLCCLGAIW